ncbi:MAG: polyketide cyclase [Bacteroidales bacterium]|jgi:carbon monoxide dehydrogenase subunit G|nr:polyketide cyclase [Bacteroidales bacterium]
MSKYTSKIGKINQPDEIIYDFLSDFRNFERIIPRDKISGFEAAEESCKFRIDGIGEAGLKTVEKEPHKLIKITSDGKAPFDFSFWIQLKPVEQDKKITAIRLTMDARLNPMMKMMVGKHLQKGIDALVDHMVTFFNEKVQEE